MRIQLQGREFPSQRRANPLKARLHKDVLPGLLMCLLAQVKVIMQ